MLRYGKNIIQKGNLLMTSINGISKKVLLVILDGFGINAKDMNNAVIHANTPNLDDLFANYPYTTINASGEFVGLPKGIMGNSEVGHLNIGAGRPVRQDLVRINEVIEKNTLSDMPKMKELIKTAKKKSGKIHLLGLLSDGGVHSHIGHIKEIIRLLKNEDGIQVFFHALMDGRDTAKNVGVNYVEELLKKPGFTFASMQGRSIGMDRDHRMEKTEHSYKTLIGQGKIENISPVEYIKRDYNNKIYDEFITPVLFDEKYKIEKDDCLFFINFRPDRAIQMTLTMTDPKFKEFETPVRPAYFLCMTPYVQDEVKLPILFDKEKIKGGLCEYFSEIGVKQFKIAETEKFAHITYFFNGGLKQPFKNEDRVLIQSPREVPTYDHKPQMSAPEVCETLLEKLDDCKHDFYLVNFANCDMVGHTGVYEATLKAVETVDSCVGEIINKCREKNISLLLTADHGNSDQMSYKDGSPHTSHTTSMVPVAVFHKNLKNESFKITGNDLALKDIAPTVLHIMDIKKPESFVGSTIFE